MKESSKNNSRLSLILFVSIVTIVNSTQNMIPPGLDEISIYFGFGGDTAPLGILTFSFMMLSGISMIIFGVLADRITRKWLVFIGTIIYSLFSLLIIFTPSGYSGYIIFFILTSINGIGFGAIIPSVFSLIGDIVKKEDRSKGYSSFSIAGLLGMIIGLALATSYVNTDWRISYGIVGALGLINSIFILFFKEPSRIGQDYDEILKGDVEIEYSYRINKEDFKEIFKKKSNLWLIINFVDTIPTGIIIFLLYNYMEEEHNIPEDMTLIILALIMLSTIIGTIIFGNIGDALFKKGNKKARVQLALFANIVPIPFIFIAFLIPFKLPDDSGIDALFANPSALAMVVLLVIGIFLNGAVHGSWYATIADINLPEHRGTILSTANFFDILGKALGPLIGAFLNDAYGPLIAITASIFAWVLLPFFWIVPMKEVGPEILRTDKIFAERLKKLKQNQ